MHILYKQQRLLSLDHSSSAVARDIVNGQEKLGWEMAFG
jgi:hypothetical protein